MLHNMSIPCLLITTFIGNCCMEQARLLIIRNHEIKSWESLIQGDPTAMGVFALGVSPLIYFLSEFIFITFSERIYFY